MKKMTMLIVMLAVLIVPMVMAPASFAKPIVLKWTSHEPNVKGSTQELLRQMAKRIDEATEGRVTIKVYWGSVLGKMPDYLKMVGGTGVADGGFIITTYHQWEIPLMAAPGLPFLTKGYRVAPRATWELYHEWPAMQEEMKKVNVKPIFMLQPHPHRTGVKQPIKTLNELKGKKIWAAGFYQELVEEIGIVNVPMAAPQAYDALQKGVIVGIMGMPYHTWKMFKYIELLKYLVSMPFGGVPVCLQAVNLDVWNKISPKDQKAIEGVMEGLWPWFLNELDEETRELKDYYASQGVKEIDWSPEGKKQIEEVGKKTIWGSWMATAKKEGVPGEEFFRRYQAKVAEVLKR